MEHSREISNDLVKEVIKIRRYLHKYPEISEKEYNTCKYIRNYLTKRKKVKFTDLFEEYTKDLVVATFLSILDMCKQKEITLKQDSNFSEIYIERVNL